MQQYEVQFSEYLQTTFIKLYGIEGAASAYLSDGKGGGMELPIVDDVITLSTSLEGYVSCTINNDSEVVVMKIEFGE